LHVFLLVLQGLVISSSKRIPINPYMKTKHLLPVIPASLFVATLSAAPFFLPVTYQGRLDQTGAVANGNFELQVGLFDAATSGSPVQLLTNNISVSNGLFTTVLQLDGVTLQNAATEWLELGVRTNGSAAVFTILTPRQQLTYVPLAARADVAGIANDFPQGAVYSYHILDGSIEAQDIDSGQVVKSLNGLTDAVTLAAGGGITITPVGNTLTISNTGWKLNGNAGTTAGTHFLGTTDNQPVEIKVNGIRAWRLEPAVNDANHLNIVNVVGGSPANAVPVGVYGAVISGGGAMNVFGQFGGNRVDEDFGTISGGYINTIQTNAHGSTIGGGRQNTIETNAGYGTISGGAQNTIQADNLDVTIGGGVKNTIQSNNFASIIGGGRNNTIQQVADFSTIGGGDENTIQPHAGYATIPGGRLNAATNYAFAAGNRAKANHSGAFVWADSQDADFPSTGTNQFRVRAAGGMEIVGGANVSEALKYSGVRSGGFAAPVGYGENNNTTGFSAPAMRLVTKGGISADGVLSVSTLGTGNIATFGNASVFVSSLTTNGTWSALAFNPTSDRNAKENFVPVDPQEVLAKVAALPIAQWNYKAVAGVDHIGPVAQDFHAAFGLNGDDNKHIATVDADGVALAAIQGLNQKLQAEMAEKDRELQKLRRELDSVKAVVERLAQARN
jgi:hypothetical protein